MQPARAVKSSSLITGSHCHTGLCRNENQDRRAAFRSPFGEVFVVADGMGGHRGGATAAEMVVNGMEKYLAVLPADMPLAEALRKAAQLTNEEVHQEGQGDDESLAGMGSTLVVAVVHEGMLTVAHVGDSRAYLVRDHKLTRLTRDHTVPQRLVEAGILSEEAADDHPDSSVLTRAVGQYPRLDLDVGTPVKLEPGDGIMLCSDGLCGYVRDEEIQKALVESPADGRAVADRLLNLALKAGGPDNITVQYVCNRPPETQEPPLQWKLPVALAAIVLVICAAVLLVIR